VVPADDLLAAHLLGGGNCCSSCGACIIRMISPRRLTQIGFHIVIRRAGGSTTPDREMRPVPLAWAAIRAAIA